MHTLLFVLSNQDFSCFSKCSYKVLRIVVQSVGYTAKNIYASQSGGNSKGNNAKVNTKPLGLT